MCTYVRYAGPGESEQPVGIVALHDPQSSDGSGQRETRASLNPHQQQVEQLLSLLLFIIPDLHHKGLLPLLLSVAQVTREVPQVCFGGLGVKLVDVTAVQFGSVQADVLQEACVTLLSIRVRANEH